MLNDYLTYTATQESPTVYHTWVAISMVAACLERNVWLDRGFYKIFPNLYTMLIGDSAIYKKSTCVEMGKDLLYELEDQPTMFEGQTTIPFLVKELGGEKLDMVTGKYVPKSRIYLIAPELSVFFRDEQQAREIVYFMTDFYTGKTKPWRKGTVTSVECTLMSPCINFIGCSTAEWLAVGLSTNDFGGGFMGRCLFIVPMEQPKRIAHPTVTEQQKQARQHVVDQLKHIRTLRGEYPLTDDAKQFYDRWYNSRPVLSSANRLKSYFERKTENVLKLSIIKAAMDNSIAVGTDELTWALEMLNALEPSMPQAFQFIGTDENVLAELIIAHLTITNGKDSYVNTINFMGPRLKSYQQFNNILEMLIRQERIRRVNNGVSDMIILTTL